MKTRKQLRSVMSAIMLTIGILYIPFEGYAQTPIEAETDTVDYDLSAFDALLDEVQIVAIKPVVKAEADIPEPATMPRAQEECSTRPVHANQPLLHSVIETYPQCRPQHVRLHRRHDGQGHRHVSLRL